MFFISGANAQKEVLNTNNFFTVIFEQFEADGTLVSSEAANTNSFRSAKIEDLEFRTETKDFDFRQQDYVIRLSPSTKAIRKAEEELYLAYTSKPTDNTKLIIEYKFIEDAYHYWVNEYISNRKRELYTEWDHILKDKKSIVEKQLLENDFDMSDFFKVNSEMKDLALRKVSSVDNSTLYQSPFQASNVQFDFKDIITIQSIKSFANSFDPSQNSTTLKDHEYSYEAYVIQKELNLELAQSKQIFRFGQVAISGPNKDPFKENFSIGAAFRMPWDGGNRLKIYELRHKLEEISFTSDSELEEVLVSASRAKTKLLNLIRIHEEMEDLRDEQHLDSEKFIEVIARSQGFNPMHALEVKEESIKSRLESINSLQKIYESYINLLKDSQLMFKTPYTNYLL